ncbi:putative prenyl protein specific carboxyl methyltransferase [Leishmania mexicana MHOM/GT/2001/U1103]|uniref:Protein-S-isoprenylcysteine O-methyltransferase n=1 Tax=Leishmania mexicana (strain MHOM/GT/2001/U1103) TaxID=929439 RepID=E9B6I2_LEIMU|nr:putative prenyl protein specific carboxyl methyltransferase [Leishmania mexicana MHOM/GT/2001/U1103]CBZ30854.1 putative prenyl protein specific carboxyl methyltransferase [Leishmania mexicana MHOM/GT/2001/U1103]
MSHSSAPEELTGEKEAIRRINRELQRNLILETALIAFALGVLALAGVLLAAYGWHTHDDSLFALGLYILVVHIAFHVLEFLVAGFTRPHDTHPDAFMVFHSTPYLIASGTALLEFFVELYAIPETWKLDPTRHAVLGFFVRVNYASALLFTLLVVVFYGIRVVSMLQCGSNFSLMIEHERHSNHQLVTHGLYRYLRHPAYFGWFWRTCCAQWILANPVSAVVHTGVTWYFFRSRIAYEEATLQRPDYYGEAYKRYKARTIVGIPFL